MAGTSMIRRAARWTLPGSIPGRSRVCAVQRRQSRGLFKGVAENRNSPHFRHRLADSRPVGRQTTMRSKHFFYYTGYVHGKTASGKMRRLLRSRLVPAVQQFLLLPVQVAVQEHQTQYHIDHHEKIDKRIVEHLAVIHVGEVHPDKAAAAAAG